MGDSQERMGKTRPPHVLDRREKSKEGRRYGSKRGKGTTRKSKTWLREEDL